MGRTSHRARPIARRLSRAVMVTALILGGLDGLSRVRSFWVVWPGSCALIADGGGFTLIVVLDPSTTIMRPAPGFGAARASPGYGIGSRGESTVDEPFPGVRRARAPGSGALHWFLAALRPAWCWVPLLVAGLAGLALTRRFGAGHCPSCGYPLAGLPAGAPRCPECGRETAPAPAP